MIFATVGTQLPFPRLMTALDAIAGRHKLEILAQTCDPAFKFENMQGFPHLDPQAFEAHISQADRLVGHAGIGTILSGRRAQKPLILYPRRASLGEHRNEHQLATVQSLGDRVGIYIAYNDEELETYLTRDDLLPLQLGDSPSRNALVSRIAEFIAY